MLIVLLLECGWYFEYVKLALFGFLVHSFHPFGHLFCTGSISQSTLLFLHFPDAPLSLNGLDTLDGSLIRLFLVKDSLQFFLEGDPLSHLWVRAKISLGTKILIMWWGTVTFIKFCEKRDLILIVRTLELWEFHLFRWYGGSYPMIDQLLKVICQRLIDNGFSWHWWRKVKKLVKLCQNLQVPR